MSLDKSHPQLELLVLPELLYIYQYPASTSVPPSLFEPASSFLSITRTPHETSIVLGVNNGPSTQSPKSAEPDGMGEATHVQGPWRAFQVRGPMDFGMSAVQSKRAD